MTDKLDLIKARVASLEILNNPAGGRAQRLGVTPGGFHHEEDGTAWYVKHHIEPNHSHMEHLNNQIYRALGHNAPHSAVLYHHNSETGSKEPVYFSKKIAGFSKLEDYHRGTFPDHHTAHRYLQGSAADALIGNADLHSANMGIVHDKVPTRIDNGSGLRYKGGGEERGDYDAYHGNQLHDVLSWSSTHGAALEKTGLSTKDVLSAKFQAPHVKQILHLRNKHGGWQGFVNRHIPGAHPDVRKDAANILEVRTRHLVDHVVNNYEEEKKQRPSLIDHLKAALQPSPPKGKSHPDSTPPESSL